MSNAVNYAKFWKSCKHGFFIWRALSNSKINFFSTIETSHGIELIQLNDYIEQN